MKDKTINIRVGAGFKGKLNEIAESEKETASLYIRKSVVMRAKGHTVDMQKLFIRLRQDLSRIGNNLNQISRSYNQQNLSSKDVLREIENLRKILSQLSSELR